MRLKIEWNFGFRMKYISKTLNQQMFNSLGDQTVHAIVNMPPLQKIPKLPVWPSCREQRAISAEKGGWLSRVVRLNGERNTPPPFLHYTTTESDHAVEVGQGNNKTGLNKLACCPSHHIHLLIVWHLM